MFIISIIYLLLIIFINLTKSFENDFVHSTVVATVTGAGGGKINLENPENSAEFWREKSQQAILKKLKEKLNYNVAKNVILFLGDGMSIATITATRIYLGGEEINLTFDKFPYSGQTKTYCIDHQVPDSACTATAYLGGVKGNLGTIGVTGNVNRQDCKRMIDETNHVPSIASYFQENGRKSGFVTTARVTHASPAGVYGHTAERSWESDTDVLKSGQDPNICIDLASQLVKGKTGKNLNVIMGGGRSNFLPMSMVDNDDTPGQRTDEQNLINEWIQLKNSTSAKYIWNRKQLLEINNETTHLFGLFNSDHMNFNLERDPEIEPSLTEMTERAIQILNNDNNRGYFLFVEGARIDMGHHYTMARKALDETVEFSKAIQKALEMTKESDTLIIVTSDHAHTMTIGGYPKRKSDILGVAGTALDDVPYTILTYANGPLGHKRNLKSQSERYDIRNDDTNSFNYQFPSLTPLNQETHGGEDVAVFAKGPWSHLFTGVMEENLIPRLISFASCVGNETTICDELKNP